ncbi:MAG: PD40 domain-containing protein [Gammaproteobacteria bacterium]|nr:PD40 domain-containing protein [Gammaproteobacteria bacterium]
MYQNMHFVSGSLVLAASLALSACASGASKRSAGPVPIPEGASISTREGELPSWQIPNLPTAAEAYYGPDSHHLVAQVSSPKALKSPRGTEGFLTQTFTDDGREITLINDRGWDACSYYFPDGKHLVWTSIKDHPDLPPGNWSNPADYPRGAELYVSDLAGGNVRRLTDNLYYEAEASVSPDGQWIVFGRQIDGQMDLWRMRPDGSGEARITNTPDWEEGAPYYLPDSETILFRAWKREDQGRHPTPMTVFTIRHDGTQRTQRTFTDDMNWAPYPAPDGRHFVFVRALDGGKNYEVFLGDLQGGEPRRLTFDAGFDGFPSISPDGRKMVWTSSRSTGKGFMGLRLHVMDVSSLGLGPKKDRAISHRSGR